jgi:hypothetical protein
MRRTLALAIILGAAWAAAAAADGGGPSPGPNWGQPGKVDESRGVRYVALGVGSKYTLVETIRLNDGNVMRWTSVRGLLGIPMVAWDGTMGGLSRNGGSLVLASFPGTKWTRFVELNPTSFAVRAKARLRGRFAFDALSPDGSLMYLIEYRGRLNVVNGPYAVRVFDWRTRTLYPAAIVDKREPDEKMTGQPVTRTGNPAGWAYTLYMRPGKTPFVHALDTAHRRAFCVDLPWRHSDEWINEVKLRVRGRTLVLRRGPEVLARMDTKTLEVTRG